MTPPPTRADEAEREELARIIKAADTAWVHDDVHMKTRSEYQIDAILAWMREKGFRREVDAAFVDEGGQTSIVSRWHALQWMTKSFPNSKIFHNRVMSLAAMLQRFYEDGKKAAGIVSP